jgi:hypothetical protein
VTEDALGKPLLVKKHLTYHNVVYNDGNSGSV